MHRQHLARPVLSALSLALLAACSGGDEPSVVVPPPAATRLVGTAAIGAPMADAAITVSDGDAATADVTAKASADGGYSVDVSTLKPPLLVRARATLNGETVNHSAVVASVAANADNTANVTPLTTAITTLLAPGGDVTALAAPAALASAATATQVANATALVVNTLRSDPATAALLPVNFNPTSTAFKADGTGADAVLARVEVLTQGSQVLLTNNAAPAGDNGVPAAVTLTATLVNTPASAPTLPASVVSGNVPTQAEIDALGAKLQACYALPISQRVTLDANGDATGVLGACNFTPTDWRSNGRNFVQELGQNTLRYNIVTGTKLGAGTVALTLAPEGHTDAKTFKHPYCNDGPCAVVRYPALSASGQPFSSTWVLGKVNGAWNFVGNQRPYRMFTEARLVRYQGLNPAPAGTTDPYFNTDRVESVLRLTTDLTAGSTDDLRGVRVTGPGIPAAGLFMVRSQRCATDDRLIIVRQDGSTRVPGAATAGQWWWTGGSATQFVLAANKLDGTALATPTPVINSTTASFQDFSPQRLDNAATTIPAWSRYKFEIFKFSTNADTPDEVLYLRIGEGGQNVGVAVNWPSLATDALSARVTPTGAKAGAQTSFADSISWVNPTGSYVSSAYWFGQNAVSMANSQNETASYLYRGRLDYLPAAYGDTSGAGYQFASPKSGTELSVSTATAGTNPNPRCASPGLPALTINGSDYRELGVTFRSADRELRQAIWYWRN